MASLIETLVDVLDKENTLYEQLLDLSDRKTTAIVNGDIKALQDFLVDEQKCITDITKLDEKREQNVIDICEVLNLPQKDVKVEVIIRLLEKQPAIQKSLIQVHAKLKATLDQLMKINENNKILLQESMEMIEFDLNLAKNAIVAPQTANYSRGAYEQETDPTAMGRFDAKQ